MNKRLMLLLLLFFILIVFTVSCSSTNDEGTASNDAYSILEVTFDEKIYAKIYYKDFTRKPAVILSHSANMNSDSMNLYCQEFVKRGFVAVAFDFCGASSKSKSVGAKEDMTIFTEVSDLKVVIDNVKKLSFVDKIYLFGTSQGGLVTALTANDYYEYIEGLILLYPAFNIPDIVNSSNINFTLSKNFINSLKDYNPYEHIDNFKNKVLIIHGCNDFIVNYSYSTKAEEIYDNCSLFLLEGANHGFNEENYAFKNYDKQVWEIIDSYFNLEVLYEN